VLALLIVACVGGASAEEVISAASTDYSDNPGSYQLTIQEDDVYVSKVQVYHPSTDDSNTFSLDLNGVEQYSVTQDVYGQNTFNIDLDDYDKTPESGDTITISFDGRAPLVSDYQYSGSYVSVDSSEIIGAYYDSGDPNDNAVVVSEANKAPQFNSTNISPDSPLIGENVSYGAEVFDSDGSVDYTNLTLEYGGSQVVSDVQRTGTTSPVWNDVFTPQTGDKWLNATLSVVDDAGAVTTTEINRFLGDSNPGVNINSPSGTVGLSIKTRLSKTSICRSDMKGTVLL